MTPVYGYICATNRNSETARDENTRHRALNLLASTMLDFLRKQQPIVLSSSKSFHNVYNIQSITEATSLQLVIVSNIIRLQIIHRLCLKGT
jgi:hypothetical protein